MKKTKYSRITGLNVGVFGKILEEVFDASQTTLDESPGRSIIDETLDQSFDYSESGNDQRTESHCS